MCFYSYKDLSSSNDENFCSENSVFNGSTLYYTDQTFAQTLMPVCYLYY